MASLYSPSTSLIVAGLLALAGTSAVFRSLRLLGRGLRHGRPLDVVRGIRMCVFALVAGLLAVGVLAAQTGIVILGAIILGEELYETGLLALIIRFDASRSAESAPGTPSAGERGERDEGEGGHSTGARSRHEQEQHRAPTPVSRAAPVAPATKVGDLPACDSSAPLSGRR